MRYIGTLIFFITGILLYAGFVIMHENAHVEIFKHHGIDSKINYFDTFSTSSTISETECPTEECSLGHDINDAIGYNIMSLMGLVFVGFFMIILIMESKEE